MSPFVPASPFVPTTQQAPLPNLVQNTPAVQQRSRNMAATEIPMFSGDPDVALKKGTITSKTFMKKIRVQWHRDGMTKDAEKIKALQDYLTENSPAEKWYEDLVNGANTPTTWDNLEAAFISRFPTPEKAERTPQEYERELLGMRLTVEELDKTVEVGVNIFTHVHFAVRLLELAKLAGIDATASNIWQARDALPEVIREKVPLTQKNWTSFTDTIKGIDCVYIREGAAKARKELEMERTVRDLATRDKAHPPPTTPVSKMTAQLSNAALTTPKTNAASAGVNPFGAGGGKGNLFRQAPAGPQSDQLTPEALEVLKGHTERLGRALLWDDAAGRAEYARRMTNWEKVFTGTCLRLETVGYPLSLGTVAPGSGECFGCRKITAPMHRSADCPGPRIPQRESTFRSIVNKHIRTAPMQVNAVANWIDFGEEDEQDFAEGSTD